MSLRDDIYNYEEKLSELKKEINELSRLYLSDPNSNSKLLSSKISSMKNEIQSINYQLDLFKMSLNNLANTQTQNTFVQSSQINVNNSNDEPKKIEPIQESKTSFTSNNISEPTKTETKDLENTIGKSFMGILASILIFISFILFARLLYPLLTDAIKIIAMYGISAAFTIFGLYKLKNQPKNKLYLSITGCGVGAIYISLIVSNIHFKIIGDIVLYLLIFAWAIFTAYLSRLKSNIFSIIGQAGISIALIFGNVLCNETNDINKFFVLNIFFVVSAFLFNTSKVYSKNLANNIFNLFNLFIMTSSYFSLSYVRNLPNLVGNLVLVDIIPFILLAFIIYKFVTAYTYFKLSGENIDFSIINLGYLLILSNILSEISSDTAYFIMAFIINTVFLVINEIKFKNNKCTGKTIFQIILMISLTSCCFELSFIEDYVGVCILAIPFIIYGFYTKDDLFKYAGLVELMIYIFHSDLYGVPHLLIGLTIFAILKYLIDNETEQYSNVIKIITYILFLLFGSLHIDYLLGNKYEAIEIATFIFLSIINLIAAKSKFKNNFVTGEEENSTLLITQLINAGLMLWALNLIANSSDYTAIIQTIIIFTSLALFVANTRNLLKKFDGLATGIYIGIKFTVLLLVILNAWEASSFTVSISCLLFAILGIFLGFYLKQKSFRVYGLALTMICTFKLIMVDMAYENSVGQVLSFFVSGLLCLGINAMYNMLDKKFLQENSNDN